MQRIELGNTRSRAVIDIATPAIIEMYSLGRPSWVHIQPRKLGQVVWKAAAPGAYELRVGVFDSGNSLISENIFEFEVASQ